MDTQKWKMNIWASSLVLCAVTFANIRKCIYLKYILWFMFYEGIFDGNWFIESLKIL